MESNLRILAVPSPSYSELSEPMPIFLNHIKISKEKF